MKNKNKLNEPQLQYEKRGLQMNGDLMVYRVYGTGKKPIVLIHGFGDYAETFRDVIPILLRDPEVCIYAPDLLGLGDSTKISNEGKKVGLRESAAFISEIIAEDNLENVAIVGHSLGGPIAAAVLAYQPERVTSILTLNSPYEGSDIIAGSNLFEKSPLTFLMKHEVSMALLSFIQWEVIGPVLFNRILYSQIPKERWDEYENRFKTIKAKRALIRFLISIVEDIDNGFLKYMEELKKTENIKVSVVSSLDDAVISPQAGKKMQTEHINNCVISSGGHMIHQTQPELVARLIQGCFKKL